MGLRQQHSLCYSVEDVSRQVESYCNECDYIYGSEVALSLLVHHEFPTLFAFLEQLVQFLPIQEVVGIWPELQYR